MFNSLLNLNKALSEATPTPKESPPFYASVIVIDKQRSKILLGKRREDGIFTPPGGGGHLGEHPKSAVIREAYEEANLQFKLNDLKELPCMVVKDGKLCHVFLAYVDSKKVKTHSSNDADKEVAHWNWYSINEPLPGKIDRNRLLSINAAKMRYLGLRKAIVSQPLAGIDLNTAEQSQDVMATHSEASTWVAAIRDTMDDAQFGDIPKELMLPDYLKIYLSKIDDGVFSAIVRKEDDLSGDNGRVVVQFEKMTPEAMVAALKAKGYLPSDQPQAPSPEAPKDFNGLYEALRDFQGDLHLHLNKSTDNNNVGASSYTNLNAALTQTTELDKYAELNAIIGKNL